MVVRANLEKKEERERVRAALLRATLRLAAQHGFASLGLREVSREALIAPTSFYRYFEDMEQLGRALVEQKVGPALRAIADRARAMAGARTSGATALVTALFEAIDADEELVRFFVAERVGGIATLRQGIAAEVARFGHAIDALLDEGDRSAAATDAAVAVLLEAAFRGVESARDARSKLASHTIDQLEVVARGAAPRRKRSP